MVATNDPTYIAVIARLRSARVKLNLTQAELATRMGREQSYVSKVETCERRIDVVDLLRFCDALGIPLTDVLPPGRADDGR